VPASYGLTGTQSPQASLQQRTQVRKAGRQQLQLPPLWVSRQRDWRGEQDHEGDPAGQDAEKQMAGARGPVRQTQRSVPL
jgi:hypothetical protein